MTEWNNVKEGYYALLACILTEMDSETAIRSICKAQPIDVRAAVIRCYKKNPALTTGDIAMRLNIKEDYVRHVLRDLKNDVEVRKHYDKIDFTVLKQLIADCKKTNDIISVELGHNPKYLTRLINNKCGMKKVNRIKMEQYFNVKEGTLLASRG